MTAPEVVLDLVDGIDEAELAAQVAAEEWYHRIGLGPGIVTDGVERYLPYQRPVLAALAGLDLAGRRVLDVGCRDGLVAFAAEQQGAAEVVGADNDPSPGAVGIIVPATGSKVRFVDANVLDMTPGDVGGPFDVVIAAGLLYHLRAPFTALHVLHELLADGGTLILESAYWASRHDDFADVWCPIGRDGPHDATSPTFFNRRALRDTLTSYGFVIQQWSELGEQLRHPRNRKARLLRRQRTVDRVTVVARRDDSTLDPYLEDYFWGIHTTRGWI
jgi:SAM-dependent methyltransferase